MMIPDTILYDRAISLLSENGENPEYDRALAELCAELDPVFEMPLGERAEQILKAMRTEQAARRNESNHEDHTYSPPLPAYLPEGYRGPKPCRRCGVDHS